MREDLEGGEDCGSKWPLLDMESDVEETQKALANDIWPVRAQTNLGAWIAPVFAWGIAAAVFAHDMLIAGRSDEGKFHFYDISGKRSASRWPG